MSLASGSRLGVYEVVALLGAGGMGEVYRAKDTVLKREVALKVLLPEVANDLERVARFQREAEFLAALNHQNIAHLHSLEKTDHAIALVMELVEGETLADRIARGPISLDEALPIAKQIAEALEAAHEQGIIHRDLKPANVKVRPDGTVKVLDFGLAKALEPAVSPSSAALTNSPTISSPAMMTGVGVLLGTAAYMSPEQAKGKPADKRSDIWAHGCVLYEMLTGRVAFSGETVAETLASVLTSRPDLTLLPAGTPVGIRRLLERCLRTDRARRLDSAADVRLEIEDAAGDSGVPALAMRPRWPGLVATSLLGATVAVIIWSTLTSNSAASKPATAVRRFQMQVTGDRELFLNAPGMNVAVSPDGSTLVFTGRSNQRVVLFAKRGDELDAKPLPGTEQAINPLFSPDGRQLAFSAAGKLKRVPLDGGPVTTICDARGFVGGWWGPDNQIIYGDADSTPGLFRVGANGGAPERLTSATRPGEVHMFPQLLSDRQTVLFTILSPSGTIADSQVALLDLRTSVQTMLFTAGWFARYIPTGHIVYAGGTNTMMAVRYDATRRVVAGLPAVVQSDVVGKSRGVVDFAMSEEGTAVYLPSRPAAPERTVVWVTRDGTITKAVDSPTPFGRYPRLSPDDKQLALTTGTSDEGELWVFDLSTGGSRPRKLTVDGHNVVPTWTADGSQLLFRTGRGAGEWMLRLLPADGHIRDAETVVPGSFPTTAPDGDWVVFTRDDPRTYSDLWQVRLTDRKPAPWVRSEARESEPEFSPDGRWVAYVSDETGQSEVWVRPFPGPAPAVRISDRGGHTPVWSRTDRRLFFAAEDSTILEVSFEVTNGQFRPSSPRVVIAGVPDAVRWTGNEGRQFTVAGDDRFLMLQEPGATDPQPIVVMLNWFQELRSKVSSN